MKNFFRLRSLMFISVAFLFVCCNTTHSTSMTDNILKDGTPKLISKQFSFTEGPATDKDGNVYFTDQPNNEIWKYSVDGKLTLFMKNAGRANGMFFNEEGNLIACADENNELWLIEVQNNTTEGSTNDTALNGQDRNITHKILASGYKGKRFNGPNDVWVSPDEGMYFTDPNYKRDYWKFTDSQIENQSVYYLPKNATEAIEVISDLKKPNGIIGTPDGKTLFVADIEGNKTWKYSIDNDGKLSNAKLFVEQGSDGMTLDKNGNLYLTGNGVTIYDPSGKLIRNIPVPEDWTANVTFMGKNRDQLFITASKGIYILK